MDINIEMTKMLELSDKDSKAVLILHQPIMNIFEKMKTFSEEIESISKKKLNETQ